MVARAGGADYQPPITDARQTRSGNECQTTQNGGISLAAGAVVKGEKVQWWFI